MRVIARTALRNFSNRHKDAKESLDAWWHEARRANWVSPADIKAQYRTASIIKNDRVVFNICGNKYRLVVRINYHAKIVYIRFVGTHEEYNKIDAEVI